MMQLARDQARISPGKSGIGPYLFKENLGLGSTGTVKLAFNQVTGAKCAVKIVNKTVLRKRKEAKKEIKVLSGIEHKNIIKLEHIEEDPMNIYIFTEYYEGGDLFAYIQRNGTFDEKVARHLFRQMVEAVDFCHKKLRICHHDIKLENLVVSNDFRLKLIDFGFAVELDQAPAGKKPIKIYDGSPAYSPIEILMRRPHDESVDVFSLGICLYYMLCGCFPFCDPDKTSLEELCHNVQSDRMDFPDYLSSGLQDLIRRMLSSNRKSRITCDEIRHHSWLNTSSPTSSFSL